MKQINVTIKPSGDVTVETQGFAGDSCQQATAELLRKLGKTVSDTPTAEAMQTEGEGQSMGQV